MVLLCDATFLLPNLAPPKREFYILSPWAAAVVSHAASSYAFVEYEDPRDAEDAYYDMQGRRFDGFSINIQASIQTPLQTVSSNIYAVG